MPHKCGAAARTARPVARGYARLQLAELLLPLATAAMAAEAAMAAVLTVIMAKMMEAMGKTEAILAVAPVIAAAVAAMTVAVTEMAATMAAMAGTLWGPHLRGVITAAPPRRLSHLCLECSHRQVWGSLHAGWG